MPLVNLKNILRKARAESYAVGCFNVVDLQSIRALISAAECENSPIILAIAEVHLKLVPLNVILPLAIRLVQQSKIPIAIILDHGTSFPCIMQAMQLGISAVMFDGSTCEYNDNIQQTQEIVKIAHSLGVSVEAELGHVALPEGIPSDEADFETVDSNIYTNPNDVLDFISKTQIDALAISFGTLHGMCAEKPSLKLDLVRKINKISSIPLVMHGTSGLSDDDITSAIAAGITKINYYSDISNSIANYIQQKLNEKTDPPYYHDIISWALEKMIADIRGKLRLFGSNKKS